MWCEMDDMPLFFLRLIAHGRRDASRDKGEKKVSNSSFYYPSHSACSKPGIFILRIPSCLPRSVAGSEDESGCFLRFPIPLFLFLFARVSTDEWPASTHHVSHLHHHSPFWAIPGSRIMLRCLCAVSGRSRMPARL